ncbi:MAG: A24 family peptidase [Terracidiphilus sp.]
MHSIAWWPTCAVLAVAVFTDLRSRRIPNWLVLPFMAAGIAVSCWLNGWSGLGQSLCGLGLGALLFGVLAFMGGMGMGDVKLCAAIGAWIGPKQLILALVVTSLAGGAMAVAWAIRGRFAGELFKGAGDLVLSCGKGLGKRGSRPRQEPALANPLARKLPYAPAIAIGTLISFFAH